jgi:isopenicillin N synthase-like dioxygenase
MNIRPGFEHEYKNIKMSTQRGWAFLRDRSATDPEVVQGLRHRAVNKWPDESLVPGFRAAIERYHSEMLALGLKFVQVYAVALGLPADYFEADFVKPEWYSRLNYLPGTEDPADILGVSPHSDHSFLTLLPIAPVPGLQVRTPKNTWVSVAYVPDGLVVNTGEWLNRKSGGQFIATPHRVAEPTRERISMPVFINPRDDATSEPVPTASKDGSVSVYPTVAWHEFFCSFVGGYAK